MRKLSLRLSTLENLTDLFTSVLKLDPRNYVIHKGWFQETVPDASREIGSLALLRLDGDLYDSIKVCLEGLYDHLVPGGFLSPCFPRPGKAWGTAADGSRVHC